MPAMGAARIGIWLGTAHMLRIRPRQILILGLILVLLPSLPRGTSSMLWKVERRRRSQLMWSLVPNVFSFLVYTSLDPWSTLPFVTSLVARKFDFLPKIFHVLFLVSILIGDNISDERVYRDFPITILDRFTYPDLIELSMLDFLIYFLVWIDSINVVIP